MAKTKRTVKVGTDEENREYLFRVFSIIKRMENIMLVNRKSDYNQTDLRLMSELVLAGCENRRLISTQLADRLGVTRSAISQIVQKLEKQGVLCRIPDEVDKKIAYIELSENAREKFETEIKEYINAVGEIVARFGKAKMDKMFALIEEFEIVVGKVKEERE